MVCHFPSKAAAEAHLINKGFKVTAPDATRWINNADQITAWVADSARGWHVFFYAE
jgi:hypothetical protein